MKIGKMLLLLCCCLWLLTGQAAAIDSTKVALLPLADTAGYKSPELIVLVHDQLNDHFRFPFYDKDFVPESQCQPIVGKKSVDQESMAAVAKARAADLVVGVELVCAKSEMIQSFHSSDRDDDTWSTTDVQVAIHVYAAKDNHYQVWQDRVEKTELMMVNSGVKANLATLLEKLLAELPYKPIPSPPYGP